MVPQRYFLFSVAYFMQQVTIDHMSLSIAFFSQDKAATTKTYDYLPPPASFFLPHQKVIIGTFGEKFSFFWQKSKKIKEFSANFQSLRLVRSLWPSSDEKHWLTPFFLHVCLHIEDHGHVITLHREYRRLKK